MFGLLKLVRKVFKQIKSDLTPTQVAIGAALGVLMGLTPAGMHWIVLCMAALLFNCSMASFLLCFGLFKGLFLAIAPLAFQAGTWLLGGSVPAAEGLIAWLSEAPFFALMGYDRYLVAGGYVLALPLAALFFAGIYFGIKGYRTKVVEKIGASAWYEKGSKFFLFRMVRWIIAGAEKKEYEQKKRFILLRPFRSYMAVAIPVMLVALYLGTAFYVQYAIKDLAVGSIARAMKVNATFEEISYNFFSQKLTFKTFEMPDPKATKQNLFVVGEFEGDLGFLDLLAGRMHIEKLTLKDVQFNVRRDSDGALNITELPGVAPEENASSEEQSAWQEYLTWVQEHKDDADWTELYKKYMEYRERSEAAEAAEAAQEPAPLEYDPDLRWEYERTRPAFAIDHIEVANFSLVFHEESGDGGLPSLTSVGVKAQWISSMPGWNNEALVISANGKLDDGKTGTISLEFVISSPSTWEFRIDSVPLVKLKSLYEDSLPVVVEEGSVTLSSTGVITDGALDSSQNLKIEGLRISLKAGRQEILGLNAETSAVAVRGINAYGEKLPVVIGVAVGGTLASPEIHAGVPFLEIAKEGIKMLGEQELMKYVDQIEGQIGELKSAGMARVAPLEGDFKDAQAGVEKAIRTGDITDLEKTVEKTQKDLKDVKEVKDDAKKKVEDTKKTIKDAKDALGGLKDIFGGKKKKKDDD